MEEKALFGTILLIDFNIIVGLLASVAIKTLNILWAFAFIIPLVCGVVYFDIVIIKYLINTIKSKKK